MSRLQIISAPSVLGLKPGGVAQLGDSLLKAGLADDLQPANPVIHVPDFNGSYSFERDKTTGCLNSFQIRDFSSILMNTVSTKLSKENFLLVLGGDCSILLGIMPAMKMNGEPGLLCLDAHADFYEPAKSPTGEVADMDLAIVTGRGPELLTNIGGLRPYVVDRNVIHIGQRDAEETRKYGSQDIADTQVKRFDLKTIEKIGISNTTDAILEYMKVAKPDSYWIHFDTDVVDDEENPAVDYRLPCGLALQDIEKLLIGLLSTGKVAGMSISIFNPLLDPTGETATRLARCINKPLRNYLQGR